MRVCWCTILDLFISLSSLQCILRLPSVWRTHVMHMWTLMTDIFLSDQEVPRMQLCNIYMQPYIVDRVSLKISWKVMTTGLILDGVSECETGEKEGKEAGKESHHSRGAVKSLSVLQCRPLCWFIVPGGWEHHNTLAHTDTCGRKHVEMHT